MAKFSFEKFPAGFFDVTSDVAGPLPVGLIERWTRGPQSPGIAREILAPHAVEGIAVSTDGVGLTLLTGRRALLDILSLLDHPKQLIHAHGSAIGGSSVGLWTADNTQMFYPAAVPADEVISMLLTLQDEIRGQCEVQIGAAAHAARFFRISNGLYGADADRIETLAETYSTAGDVLVTAELFARLAAPEAFPVEPHASAPPALGSNLRVTGGPRRPGVDPRDSTYPIPYSEEFYSDLLQLATQRDDSGYVEKMSRNYGRRLAVALIEREREEETGATEVAVLNELALSLAMKKIGSSLLAGAAGHEVKTSGSVGIYTFEDCRAALDFTRRFRDTLLAQGILSRGAIDYGDILVFRVQQGLEDIAGMPVNLASKIAQDHGEFGRIYLSEAAAKNARLERELRPVRFVISGIPVSAFAE